MQQIIKDVCKVKRSHQVSSREKARKDGRIKSDAKGRQQTSKHESRLVSSESLGIFFPEPHQSTSPSNLLPQPTTPQHGVPANSSARGVSNLVTKTFNSINLTITGSANRVTTTPITSPPNPSIEHGDRTLSRTLSPAWP
jgi:hypothetical protein